LKIDDYLTQLEHTIISAAIVSSHTMTIDRKTDHLAFVSGIIEMRDGSLVDFKEFIEAQETEVTKYKYGYNYRKGTSVIFRYDNAPDPRARSLATFPHHKHVGTDVILPTVPPTLEAILEEVMDYILDTWTAQHPC
jgi:hypothetical protein